MLQCRLPIPQFYGSHSTFLIVSKHVIESLSQFVRNLLNLEFFSVNLIFNIINSLVQLSDIHLSVLIPRCHNKSDKKTKKVKSMVSRAENFRIVDIEINAWSPLIIFNLISGKVSKIQPNRVSFAICINQSEVWKFCEQSMQNSHWSDD